MDPVDWQEHYDNAILPANAVPLIDRARFRLVKKWQKEQELAEGDRVLTVDKLPDTSREMLKAFQEFVYECALKHPMFQLIVFNANPKTSFDTADEFVAYDCERQWLNFKAVGKRGQFVDPKESAFPNKDVWSQAIEARKFLCTDAEHEGDPWLGMGAIHIKGGKSCKQCKARNNLKNADPPRFDTAEAWHTTEPNTRPKRSDFTTEDAYTTALGKYDEMKAAERAAYQKKYHADPDVKKRKYAGQAIYNARPDVKERKNAQARARHARP